MKNNHFSKVRMALLVGFLTALVIIILHQINIFETMELKTFDFRVRHFSRQEKVNKDIVIISIDQNSIDFLKYKYDILWKWPRDIYAYVIRYLHTAGAKAILLDFDFSDPDINRAEFEEGETDRLLGDAIKEAGIIINSTLFYKKPINEYMDSDMNSLLLGKFSIPLPGKKYLHLPEYQAVVTPISTIMKHSQGVGASNIYPDRDGNIRRVKLFYNFKGTVFPVSALSLSRFLLKSSPVSINKDYEVTLADHVYTTNKEGELYINWYGPGGPSGNTYKYFPIVDILISYYNIKREKNPLISPEYFKDKIVLIGSNAPSLYDLKPTPLSGKGAYPGVEIIATIVNNLLDGSSIYRIQKHWITLFIFLGTMVTSCIVSFIPSVLKNTGLSIFFVLSIFFLAVFSFYFNLFLPIVPVEFGIVFSFTAMTAINFITEGREKRWVKNAFSHYVPMPIISEILKNPEKLKLGGERRDLSILFSDIRGFTRLSETMKPEELVSFLNEYFTPMTDLIFKHKGTLDKYIGDAIMALFGAPLALDFHEIHACYTALDMLEALQVLRKSWKNRDFSNHIQDIDIGIGINAGIVSIGNMGSSSLFDYTAIGDEVNLTARLESLNKIFCTNILVSENVYKKAKDVFIFRDLDIIKVVGKTTPVKIFELIQRKDHEDYKKIIEEVKIFKEGLFRYREQEWDKAAAIFESLYQKDLSQKVCQVFASRCRFLKTKNLPSHWDRVSGMRTKT